LRIPSIIVVLTVVAIGTSLPELVTAVTSSRKSVSDLAVGNVLAANIANHTFIVGVVCFLKERYHCEDFIAGIVVGSGVQQVAYQVWKADLPGFWSPLAQFGSLSYLISSTTAFGPLCPIIFTGRPLSTISPRVITSRS